MGNKSWSQIFMILWFAIYGILAITNITFALSGVILGILAILIALALAFGK